MQSIVAAFTVRTVSSSLTDTYVAISAGIASLAGHLHGGANEAVMNMLEDLKKNVKDWQDEEEIYFYLNGRLEKGLIIGVVFKQISLCLTLCHIG